MKTLKETLVAFGAFIWFAVMLTLLTAGCFGGFCAAFLQDNQQLPVMVCVAICGGLGVFMSILTDRYIANNRTPPTK